MAAGRVSEWRRGMATTATALFFAGTAAIAMAPVSMSDDGPPPSIDTGTSVSNELALKPFYADPTTSAAAAAGASSPPSAELARIAGTPQVRWVDSNDAIEDVAGDIRQYIRAADAGGALPMIATYAVPHRDCGGFSAGGMATAEEYRSWVEQVAAGIGGSPVAVVVEPDALTALDCLPSAQQAERLDLLRFAVQTLTRNPSAAVYIDGGHSRWLSDEELARRLRAVDVGLARGFALNTSNFLPTGEEIDYGERVSLLTGGTHYVIDTSRNGAGPAPDAPLNWCNPPGRALGTTPTTVTAGPHADAYLWIKHPGESDGDCGRGDPSSGAFMTDYAIALARNAEG